MRLGLSLCRTAAVIQGKASLKLPGTVFTVSLVKIF